MADVTLTADGSQAIRELRRVQDSVRRLGDAFNGLRNVVAGGALAAFVTQLANYASSITNASRATDIAADAVKNYSDAVAAAGGDSRGAVADLGEFTKKISEAISGSGEAADAFRSIGVSAQDLIKLDNTEILKRTLDGLGKLPDSAMRSRSAMALLGGEFKKISTIDVSKSFGSGFSSSNVGVASALQTISDAQRNLGKIFREVANELILVIEPIARFAAELRVSHDAIKNTISFLKELLYWLIAIGSFFIGGVVTRGISIIVQGLSKLARVIGGLSGSIGSFIQGIIRPINNLAVSISGNGGITPALRSITPIVAAFGNTWQKVSHALKLIVSPAIDKVFGVIARGSFALSGVVASLTSVFSKTFPLLARYVSMAITSIAGKFKYLIGIMGGVIYNFQDFFKRIWTGEGALSSFEKVLNAILSPLQTISNVFPIIYDGLKKLGDAASNHPLLFLARETGKFFDQAADKAKKFFTERPAQPEGAYRGRDSVDREEWAKKEEERKKKAAEEEKDRLAQRNKAMAAMRTELRNIQQEYQKSNNEQLSGLQLQIEMVGKTEDEREVMQAIYDTNSRITDKLGELRKKVDEWRNGTDLQKAAVGDLLKLIDQIEKGQQGVVKGAVDTVKELQNARRVEQDRLRIVQQTQDAYSNQLNAVQALREKLAELSGQNQTNLAATLFEGTQMGLSNSQKAINQINRDAEQLIKSQTAALEAAAANATDPAIFQELQDSIAQITKEINLNRDAVLDNLSKSQQWKTGWQEAWANYVDTAATAAEQARDAFQTITSQMEDALANFVRTGKLNFKDLVRNIIADLTSKALVNAFRNLVGMMGGGGGGGGGGSWLATIGSFLGSFLGFANGGNPPVNRPSIVGEKGPELFVPKTAGTVIPNGGFGGSVTHNTYITNNISALDSRSVAQLFAENRRTLLGVTEQARKELPVRQR